MLHSFLLDVYLSTSTAIISMIILFIQYTYMYLYSYVNSCNTRVSTSLSILSCNSLSREKHPPWMFENWNQLNKNKPSLGYTWTYFLTPCLLTKKREYVCGRSTICILCFISLPWHFISVMSLMLQHATTAISDTTSTCLYIYVQLRSNID